LTETWTAVLFLKRPRSRIAAGRLSAVCTGNALSKPFNAILGTTWVLNHVQINTPYISTLTGKGQLTLPKQVREQLRLESGSRVDFVIEPSGRVILRPLSSDFRPLRGILQSRRKPGFPQRNG